MGTIRSDVGGKPEAVNFTSAERIDALSRLRAPPRPRGAALPAIHGMLKVALGAQPVFNKANGGTQPIRAEFWSMAGAQFRRYLDYIVARWGFSSQLMAWEIVTRGRLLTPRFRDEDIVSWHREMVEHRGGSIRTTTSSPPACRGPARCPS